MWIKGLQNFLFVAHLPFFAVILEGAISKAPDRIP